MDYKNALATLEALRVAMEKIRTNSSSPTAKDDYNEFCILYGKAEEIISRFGGVSKIEVPMFGSTEPSVYPNFIEAGYLS